MQRIILSLFLLLISGAVFYYYISPAYHNIKNLRKENEALETVAEEIKGLVEKKNELADLYDSISESDRRKLEALAPSNPRIAEFLVKLEALILRNGMRFTAVNFGEPAGELESAYQTMSLSLGLAGSYETLKSFLKDVEKFVRIIDVDTIGFSSPAKFGDPLSVPFAGRMYKSK